MSAPWPTLGVVPGLAEQRVQAHHAAQVVAALGFTHLAPRPDDGHPNLQWSADHGALLGRLVEGPAPYRAALRLSDLALLLVDGSGRILDELTLAGRSVDAAYAWLDAAIALRVPGATALARPKYEIPEHPVASGASFSPASEPLSALADWFAAAQSRLTAAAAGVPGATEVRCWPHHFDTGLLVVIDAEGGESARSVGMGMSPGDAGSAEPYWYVTPWPVPVDFDPPPLASGGHWQTDGFTGAVLTAAATAAAGAGRAQEEAVDAFLDSALDASRALLGAAD